MRVRTTKEIGLAVREERRKRRLKQEDLARQVGVSRQWVIELERGKPSVDANLLLRTLNALNLILDVRPVPRTRSVLDDIIEGSRRKM